MTNVLLVGPWDSGVFQLALQDCGLPEPSPLASECSAAYELLAQDNLSAELIWLAQPLPDTYTAEEITELHALAPLAAVVAIAGTWCEGEPRSGKPLAGVLRLYWYELGPWWRAARAVVHRGECPPWAWLNDGPLRGRIREASRQTEQEISAPLAIATNSWDTFQALSTSLDPLGIKCLWTRPGPSSPQLPDSLRGGIWDGGKFDDQELKWLGLFCQSVAERGGQVVALADFPRHDQMGLVRSAGATYLIGKPYFLGELMALFSAEAAT